MQKLITKTISFLKKGQTILYPTDTIWGIGCDVTNFDAVKKVYQLKNREESKSLIILVDSLDMLQNYVGIIPEKVKIYLEKQTRPTTVIYDNPKNLAKNVLAKDDTVAIRIINSGFAYQLIKAFGKPIVSTSANKSGAETPLSFKEISSEILEGVDYVVHHKDHKKEVKSSKIIRFVGDTITILRD